MGFGRWLWLWGLVACFPWGRLVAVLFWELDLCSLDARYPPCGSHTLRFRKRGRQLRRSCWLRLYSLGARPLPGSLGLCLDPKPMLGLCLDPKPMLGLCLDPKPSLGARPLPGSHGSIMSTQCATGWLGSCPLRGRRIVVVRGDGIVRISASVLPDFGKCASVNRVSVCSNIYVRYVCLLYSDALRVPMVISTFVT